MYDSQNFIHYCTIGNEKDNVTMEQQQKNIAILGEIDSAGLILHWQLFSCLNITVCFVEQVKNILSWIDYVWTLNCFCLQKSN